VVLFGGATGRAEPAEVLVEPGDYLQFTTGDSWIHEVLFEVDSLATDPLSFMTGLDQMASPPMVSRGSRFVVSFVDAPVGRYPYRVEGNGPVVHGVVVVARTEGR
jgi:plastocyanin